MYMYGYILKIASFRGDSVIVRDMHCQVTVVELSRPSPSLPEILSGIGSTLVGVDRTLKELLQGLTFSDGVQARMDGIMFERLEGYPYANPILTLIKDYLSSL